MTQKRIEERLDALEAEIEAIKKEVQRLPVLEKTMEKLHAMLTEIDICRPSTTSGRVETDQSKH